MTNRPLLIILTFIFTITVRAQTGPACRQFETMVKSTYTFRPSRLDDAQQTEKSNLMDRVWEFAKANRKDVSPCLVSLLKASDADPFFIFDGSNLLTEIDPSKEAKQLQVDSYARTLLDDVNLRVWVSVIARRGSEGFDTSKAGLHWLSYPKGRYFIPEHGAYEITHEQAALIIFGTMDESLATPTLLAVATNKNHAKRETAVKLLVSQVTPESIQGLARLDVSGLSAPTSSRLRQLLTRPELLKPRVKPKTSREQFVRAFEAVVNGNREPFLDLVVQVPDGEHDVVAVLRSEDIPLVRKVRRMMLRTATQHALGYYDSFTAILMTLVWKPELAR